MIKNMVVLKLNDQATEERLAEVEAALAELPGKIAQIRSYAFGRNLSIVPGTSDFGIVSEFDDEDGYRTYSDHPEHQRVVTEILRPLIAERASVQFRW